MLDPAPRLQHPRSEPQKVDRLRVATSTPEAQEIAAVNISMMTNAYWPHVGGVARSVQSFAEWLRRAGHPVLIAAPQFESAERDTPGVVRVPAIEHWHGTDFSLPLPLTAHLRRSVERFQPHIVHSHHPFLLGDTALRVAAQFDIPVVFTHHTMYERYTHYVPAGLPHIKQFAIELATGYADLCDAVIAPSESLRSLLCARGVRTPITVIPTGVDIDRFGRGDGSRVRSRYGVPTRAFVAGHVGRLAPEKNLAFLVRSLVRLAARDPAAHIVIVGDGPEAPAMQAEFARAGLADRLHLLGTLEGEALVDAYHAMDVFCFASTSETQGLVLAEAMAAGLPVVGLDAAGVRDIVRDADNGRLVLEEDEAAFVRAIEWAAAPAHHDRLVAGARRSACSRSVEAVGSRLLELYQHTIEGSPERPRTSGSGWPTARRLLVEEWRLAVHRAHAMTDAWRVSPRRSSGSPASRPANP